MAAMGMRDGLVLSIIRDAIADLPRMMDVFLMIRELGESSDRTILIRSNSTSYVVTPPRQEEFRDLYSDHVVVIDTGTDTGIIAEATFIPIDLERVTSVRLMCRNRDLILWGSDA